MNGKIALTLFIIGGVMLVTAMSCDECGEECRKLCGTKQFRTCCFNYLRKRGGPTPEEGPDLRLEVSLANSQGRRLGIPSSYLLPPYAAYAPYVPILKPRTSASSSSSSLSSSNNINNDPEQERLHLVYDA